MLRSQSLGYFRTSSNVPIWITWGYWNSKHKFIFTWLIILLWIWYLMWSLATEECDDVPGSLTHSFVFTIHTNSDNLHSNETFRARQCPQVFICHPLLSFWVEFNYPTNLGVALPDVEYWPRGFKWKSSWIPKRMGNSTWEEKGCKTGDLKSVMSS